ncbi:MAG: hypothetical protein WCI03_03975 [bacterium]
MSNQYVIPLSWRNVTLVFAAGVTLWLVPWLVFPSSYRTVAKTERHSPPIFRYIRAAQGLDGSTWSPVLMPLPTPDGFSKKAALKELPNKSLVSVLKPKISGPVYMTLEPGNGVISASPRISFLQPVEFDPEVSQKSITPDAGSRAANVFRFEIQEPLRYRLYEFPDLQMAFSNGDDKASIMVTAAVELDKQGLVQHVLLEQPAGISGVDSMIVRGLRTGRGQPGTSNTWGQVKFFYWKNSPVQKE